MIEVATSLEISHTDSIDASTQKLEKVRQKIQAWGKTAEALNPENSARLRAWEGSAAKAYFQLLSASLPPPLPFKKRSRRPAKDPFNCMLNYAYGILYGRLAGIDPYMGVFHRDNYNRPVLVYDCIESYRHWAESVVQA